MASNPAPSSPAPKVTVIPQTLPSALEALNTRFVYCTQLAQVVRIPTPSLPDLDIYSPATFVNSLERQKIGGRVVSRIWIDWPNRRNVYKLVYAPGQPQITDGNLNTWQPPAITAQKGDITLWLDYLSRIFASDPTYRDWFLAWLAYPIQNPGAKLHTAVVFWSEQTATGKSMLGRIMSQIYGPQNYAQIDESTLHNPFNFWANGRQFVMGEEIRGASSQKNADRLKAMITQQVVYINLKQKAQFELRDCLNYYFTSNHPDAFYLDPNDRRFFVHNLGDRKYPADLYFEKFSPWFYNGGAEAIRYHLENIDLSQPIVGGDPSSLIPHRFNPGAAAPQSRARQSMVLANRNDAETWIDELCDNPIEALNGSTRSLMTSHELYTNFTHYHKGTRIPYKTFCTHLRQRIKPVYADNKLKLSDGRSIKVYPIGEDSGKWVKIGHDALVAAYEADMD